MTKKPTSLDKQLTDHLRKAEEELIGAVKLFSDQKKLSRRVGYYTRLIRAQELITGLYREELVRMRGSVRARGKRR